LIWNWLRDGENRKVIAWIGSGLMVATGALVYQNTRSGPEPVAENPTSSITVTVGKGVGAGGSMQVDGDVNVGSGTQGDAKSPQQ
jgi:hypothetical protein